MPELNQVTDQIIGCAIEVHRALGPGLPESIYEKALCIEMHQRGLDFDRQITVPVFYKGQRLGDHRLDLLVEDQVVVELKAVDRPDPVFHAQVQSYLKLAEKPLGLLINFNVPVLRDGIKKFKL